MVGLSYARMGCFTLALGWWLACVFFSGAASPLIDPQSTVILFSGIPGDVESETTYRDQMTSWLGAMEAQGATQRVYVLCDDPKSVPPQPKAFVQTGDRESFLKLSPGVPATNPVVVVVWGHGGNQGSIPVFHVRGPRLAPQDFVSFAARMGTNQSKWVLLFRGSGAFARALAAPGRQILSSECDTVFASDPVGMTLLPKLVRDEPALPFEALSEKLGAAVQRWYGERNLARTEEPTWWQDTRKPVLLIGADDGGPVVASAGEGPESAVTRPELAEAPEPTRVPEVLPPTWLVINHICCPLFFGTTRPPPPCSISCASPAKW